MATDYTLPAVAEKRTRFFDGQFLVDQDFVDEQKYHLDRQRRHQRMLHVSGVCEGLEVRATGLNTVSVGPGTAVDADGRTLALAAAVAVDLPATTFNGKSGVTVHLAYEEASTDQQKGQGSADDTRWLERPVVVKLLPGAPWTGSTPLVPLAQLALDGRGAVTVDLANRQYAGVRLPGPAADPAALRSVSSGAAALQGTLSVTGHVGVGTASPENAEGWQRVVDVLGGANAKLSVRTGAVDARVMAHDTGIYGSAAGMLVGTRTAHPLSVITSGATRLTVSAAGKVGIGTDPKQEPRQELTVNGRMYLENGVIQRGGTTALTTTSDLGLYSQTDGAWIRLVTNKAPVRLYTDSGIGTTARLTVEADGDVGVGVEAPAARLDVSAVTDKTQSSLLLRSGNASNGFDATQLAFGFNGGAQYRHAIRTRHNGGAVTGNALDFYVWAQSTAAGAADAVGGTHVMSLDGGHVGIGTTTAENGEGWSRVLDVLGAGNAKLSVRTATGKIDARLMAHDDGFFGAPSGMVVGTKSTHPLSLATAGATRLTLTADGHVGIGTTTVDNAEKWARIVDVYSRNNLRMNLRTDVVESRIMAHDGGTWGADRGMVLGTRSAHAVTLATGGAARMTVSAEGKVGVGGDLRRLGPEAPDLTVNGGMAVIGGVIQNRPDRLITDTTDLGLYSQTSGHWLRLVTSGGPIHFFTDGESGRNPQLTINPNGQIVVAGELYVTKGLNYYWGPDRAWKNIQNRASDFAGSYSTGGPSDARLKTAVRPLRGALASVLRLTGLRYRWDEAGLEHLTRDVADGVSAGPDATEDEHRRTRDAAVEKARAALAGEDIGLLAQDVERVVPEVVHDGPGGYKHIRYAQLTALLVEAVKEQQALIGELRSRIAACEAR